MRARDVRRVGVVGCGLMGSGIVEVCARGGLDVTFVEGSDELVDAGWDRIGRSSGSSRRPREARSRAGRGRPGSHRRDLRARRPGRGRSRDRGRDRRPHGQGGDLRSIGRAHPPGGGPRLEHVVDPDLLARRGERQARARRGDALLQPGAGDALDRAHALGGDRARTPTNSSASSGPRCSARPACGPRTRRGSS